MKKIIAYFIQFPVAVNVVILSFIVFGLAGAMRLKSSFFPLTDSRKIIINLFYPGASPIEMEEGVVLKIEDNLKGIVGIDRVTSISKENTATITVETQKGKSIDVVLADVKNAVDRVPSFPSGMEPPIIAKRELVRPTINFIVSGKNISLKTLKQQARKIENDIRAMEGISQISLSGFPDEEIEIALSETSLRSYNLTFEQVANAVRQSNLLTTGGKIKTEAEEYLIRARNRKYHADELSNLVVKSDLSGNIIRLKDVATVKDTWSENPNRVFYNGQTAINFSINNTKNEDLIGSAEKIKKYITRFNAHHKNLQLIITSDSSVTLKQRTELLLRNGAMGVVLVLIFLSLFLNYRLALWVAAGLPIAFLGMFIFVSHFGVTINVLSLFGMIIVIGILVDDGIVIGENIYQHYEQGKSPVKAAVDGTLEVIPPVISAILTTLLAFAVFFFVDGRMGDFFGQVSTVVSLTLLISLFEAIIILPAHIVHSKALEKKEKKRGKIAHFFYRINEVSDKGLKWVRDKLYAPYLRYFLKNRFLGFAIPVAILLLTIGALKAGIIRTGFFPNIASDRVQISLNMPQGTNEKITDSIISLIEEKAWKVNKKLTAEQNGNLSVIKNSIKHIGPGTSRASLTLNLLPGESRDISSFEVARRIRKAVGDIPQAENLSFGSGTHMGGSPIAVSLLGSDIHELENAKKELKKILAKDSRIKDVVDNDPAGIKEINIKLKNKAYLLGLSLQSVMRQVRNGFFGFQAQRFQRGQDEIKVWVRYTKENRSSIKDLDNMWLLTPAKQRVPFSEIATYTIKRGTIAINHLNGQREIQVKGDLKSLKESATEIMDEIKTRIMPELTAKYTSISASYEGQNREATKTMKSLPGIGLVILALIYVTIAFTFRSYSQPLLLLVMVPFSLIGVIWGHYFHDFKVNVLSWLGIIALIGIMVNDGLVLVDKFNAYLREGYKYDEALTKAGISRFRAIFLTSITTVAGMMPLLLETSRQAQFLKPMAISISYGIIISTFLTLLMLPLLLSFWNTVLVWKQWLLTGKKPDREDVERAIIEMKAAEEQTSQNTH